MNIWGQKIARRIELETKIVHRLLAPRVPFIVSTLSNGRQNLAPVSNITSIATEPQRVCAAIVPEWSTARAIELTSEFVLNLMSADHLDSIWICGAGYSKIDIPSELSKSEASGLTLIPSTKVAPASVAEAIGSLECRVFAKHNVGDHILFLADILAASVRSDSWDKTNEMVDLRAVKGIMQNAKSSFVETGRVKIPNTRRLQRRIQGLKAARD